MARVSQSVEAVSKVEVIEMVLNRGVLVEAWVAINLVGLRVLDIETRILIASVDRYLKIADAIGQTAAVPPLMEASA